MSRSVDKEQFFTTDENAEFCISKINLSEYDRIIEPSAGNGSFSKRIYGCMAFDIEPLDESIIKADFLSLNIERNVRTLVIGNPPFGRQSSLAIKFINKSALFADTIAFILPLSFKKESMISKLDKHIHLVSVYELRNDNFYFGEETFHIPCAFFIFEYKDELRGDPVKEITSDFEFVCQEDADNSIRRVGVYAGRIESLDVSPASHYFVKWNVPEAKEIFSNIKFTFNNTVGPRSISKNEIIRYYNNQKAHT